MHCLATFFVLAAAASSSYAVATAKKAITESDTFHIYPLAGPLSATQTQKTIMCPASPQNLHQGYVQYGQRTRFIVKNTASDPVVISYVEESGREISAADAKTYPAQADPQATLAPGVTKVFAVTEGDVFHVRDSKTGELLMQHRAGLIPIKNRYNQHIDCSGQPETKIHSHGYRKLRKFQEWEPVKKEQYEYDVEFPAAFHNTIISSDGTKQCPVNMYFVTKQYSNTNRPPNYVEKYKFHLGTNHKATLNGTKIELNSSTKYERAYLGHEFAARLAHNDNVVVDYITFSPIRVEDCSDKKQTADVAIKSSAAHATPVIIPVGARHQSAKNLLAEGINNETKNGNHDYFDVYTNLINSTESKRGLYFQLLQSE